MKTPKDLFNEIVKLADSALKKDEANIAEVIEKVALADAPIEDVPVADAPKEDAPSVEYISRAEFDDAIKEMKEMYTKVLEVISPEESKDVPEELPKEDAAVDQQLSSNDSTDTLKHNPEVKVEAKNLHLYSQGRQKTTQDYVFESLFKK
ncbi:MAG: hypothetical protein HQ473_07415 [Cryomorphaceae bacterium]|nr:hypothetical protein [Cryomorphaceae bacterium]